MGSRTGKQCRERYLNHLNPNIKKGNWEAAEDTKILALHASMGNKWCKYTEYLPGRTDCSIKNRFHVLTRSRQVLDTKHAVVSGDSPKDQEEDQEDAKKPLLREEVDGAAASKDSDAMDVEDAPEQGLRIQIPRTFTDLDQELLDLCTSPAADLSSAGPPYKTMQPPARRSVLASHSFDLQFNPFSPHIQLASSSMDGPMSMSSTCWYSAHSPHAPLMPSSSAITTMSPLTPMIFAFDPSPAPRKRQKVLYPFVLPKTAKPAAATEPSAQSAASAQVLTSGQIQGLIRR